MIKLFFKISINIISLSNFSLDISFIKLKQALKSFISFKSRKLISLLFKLLIISSISFSDVFIKKSIAFSFTFIWLSINIKKSMNKSLLIFIKFSSIILLLFKKLIQSIKIEIVIVFLSKAL